MSNRKINHIGDRARDFFEKTARKPYKAFFALLLFFVLLSGIIFLDLKKVEDSPRSQGQIIDKNIFSPALDAKYRQAFEIINQRRANYRQADESLYPDVFRVPAEPGIVVGAQEKNLTEAEN